MPLIEDGLWQELAFRYKWKPVATGRIFKTRGDSSCQTENVICVAYCLNCQKQGISSAVSWKPRLRNYKSHIKNNMKSCKIVRHFIEEYKVASNLRFINFDVLNNVDHFSSDEIEVLLLQKYIRLYMYTCHTTQGVKWNPWLEENKAFLKAKVTHQMKFFNLSLWIIYGNQFINLQYKWTHWFL